MRSVAAAFVLSVLTLAGCGQRADTDTQNKLAAADAAFERARTPEDFVQVAAQYQEVVDDGFVSSVVLYNQGNAWQRADRHGYAIAAYLAAQRLNPRDQNLRANLQQTRQQVRQTEKAATSVGDVLLILTNYLSETEIGLLATLVLTVSLWGTFLTSGRPVRKLAVISWLMFVALAGTLGLDWYRRAYEPTGVITEAVIAYQGPATSYEAAFNAQLEEGVEFRTLSEQNDWLNIAIPDAGEGWVPTRSTALIR